MSAARKPGRTEAVMAVCTLVGTGIGWLVANHDKISSLLFRDPRIQIVADDAYVLRTGQFSVSTLGEKPSIVATDSIVFPPKWFTIPAGAYSLSVSAADDEILRREFTVEKGEKRAFVVPPVSAGSIRVTARNLSPRIGPGSPLEFQVESSGNGFLWVVERNDSSFTLVYPTGCVMECDNAILVGQGFHLPDAKGRTLTAGLSAGEERLLFLVTSRPDLEYAMGIVRRFQNAITKAQAGLIKDNWGFAELSYQVFGS